MIGAVSDAFGLISASGWSAVTAFRVRAEHSNDCCMMPALSSQRTWFTVSFSERILTARRTIHRHRIEESIPSRKGRDIGNDANINLLSGPDVAVGNNKSFIPFTPSILLEKLGDGNTESRSHWQHQPKTGGCCDLNPASGTSLRKRLHLLDDHVLLVT